MAVATTKIPGGRSCSHLRNVPSMRSDTPPSPSSPIANAFSISSIHRTTGAMASAADRASCSRCSDSPTYFANNLAGSRSTSGNFHEPATVLATSDFPQPGTPVSRMPFGS